MYGVLRIESNVLVPAYSYTKATLAVRSETAGKWNSSERALRLHATSFQARKHGIYRTTSFESLFQIIEGAQWAATFLRWIGFEVRLR
jgi:hypothetical protein